MNAPAQPATSANQDNHIFAGANNNPDVYEDQSTPHVVEPADIRRMAWRSLFLQASFNYERMQANGWLYTILPALRKIHKNENDLKKSMSMHLEFFNTHPFLVTFISGLVLAMEEAKERV
ncbi:MAG: PTS system mannose/fructose/sorbose family transporter subunit IID, partial [Cardiobacteriaceae bacterium]|nr:PTS system mannose/fructose/sorbose family transporter subunit IID [Cardiobacteriaceae bacterium]